MKALKILKVTIHNPINNLPDSWNDLKINLCKIHGKLNASWKISSLAVNGQSFLVIDGYLLDFQ